MSVRETILAPPPGELKNALEIVEGAAALIVLASKIDEDIQKVPAKQSRITVDRATLISLSKIARLSAGVIDRLVHGIERRDIHILNMTDWLTYLVKVK